MSWGLGLVAYLVIGVWFGASAWRAREPGRASSIALAVFVWPLWAPFLLDGTRARRAAPDVLEEAIEAARSASREASMDAVFSDAMATRIATDVRRARMRIGAIEGAIADQANAPTELGPATSALRARNTERLASLLAEERRALAELGELLEALRSQLVLARFAGSSEADVSGIVREVWSRVEGLGAVIAPEVEVPVTSTTSAEQAR